MELTLIMDYFTTCESKDEILELVDGVGTFSNSTFNLPLMLFNFKFIKVDVSFATSSTFFIHSHHLFQMP
jgi:hypothetical protein